MLQKEIARLQEENIEQRKKNTELEQRLSDALADKQKLDSDLKSVAGNIDADDAQKLKNDLLVRQQSYSPDPINDIFSWCDKNLP